MDHLKTLFLGIFLCATQVSMAGDDPCSATNLSLSINFIIHDNSTSSESGIVAPPYGGYTSPDYWFSFTMTGGSLFLFIEPGSMVDPALAIYQGPCNDLKLLYNVLDNNCDGSLGPSIEFDELTSGEEYFIRVWPQDNSANGTFNVYFNDAATVTPQFNAFGDATYSGDCILLTNESNFQNGCAWFEELIDFSQPFTHTMTANFGDKDGSGADGICLAYQNVSSSYCGNSGGGIGAEGMPNSAIFEFDTWQNTIYSDPPQDHCAFNVNGDVNHVNSIDGPISLGNIEDGADHEIIFSWDPAGNAYELFFDGALILSGSYDIVNNCFGGSTTAYWGYTSATGGSNNNHLICPQTLQYDFGTQEYIEELICEGETLQGHTEDGFYIDLFAGGSCSHQQNLLLSVAKPTMDLFGPYHVDCNDPTAKILSAIDDQSGNLDFPINNINYSWTGPNGQMGSNECFVSEEAGQYCLTAEISYLNTSKICEITECVIVTIDTMHPEIFTIQDITLDCNSPVDADILDASLSLGNSLTFDWFLNGVLVSNNPIIYTNDFGPGIYTLILQDNDNGCSVSAEANVTHDFEVPNILTNPLDTLNCTNEEITISIDIENWDSSDVNFIWTDPTGNLLSQNSNSLIVSIPGIYSVISILPNGCESEGFIEVFQDTLQPTLVLNSSGILDCNNDMVEISGTSTSAIASYQWSNNSMSSNTFVSSEGIYVLEIQAENGCTNIDSISVIREAIDFNFELMDSTLSCAITNFNFEAEITGNYSNINWVLPDNTNTNQSNIIIDSEGMYILEVTDDNNCILVDTMNISLDTLTPSFSFALDSISCLEQGIITIDTTMASSINWNINGQIINDTLQVYSNTVSDAILILTSANGCQTIDTISFVSNESVPDFTVSSNNINCDQDEAIISISTLDNINVSWSGPGNFNSTAEEIITQESGIYFLTVSDNDGCEIFDTLEITIDTLTPSIQIEAPIINCFNEESLVEVVNPELNWDYYYQIGNGSIFENSFITNQALSGTYVVLNPENGCTNSIPFEVIIDTIPPPTNFTFNHIDCANFSSQLVITNPENYIEYEWELPNSISSNISATTNEGGLASMNAFNTINGCSDTVFFEILVDTIAPDPTISITQMDCENSQAEITITNQLGNWNTMWFLQNELIEENTAYLETTTAGTYMIEVTDNTNSCSTSLQASIDAYIPLSAIIETTDATCVNETGSLLIQQISGGVPNYQWSLDNGQSYLQDSLISNLATGEYLLLIQDEENCEITIPFSIEAFTPLELELLDTVYINPGASVNAMPVFNIDESDIASISWSPEDILSCSDCWNPNYLILSDSTLTLTVTDINGCTTFANVHIILPLQVSIYIPNIFSPHNKDGYNDFFFPFANADSVKEVEYMQIFDRWGEQIFINENFQIGDPTQGWNGDFQDRPLQPGLYVYVIKVLLENGETELFKGDVTLVD